MAVTRDATKGWAFPQSVAEMTALQTGWGLTVWTLTHVWLFQEASGNFSDSGPNGATLTATGTIAYQQAVTGFSFKAMLPAAGGANYGVNNTAPSLSDGTGALALLAIAALPAVPAADRMISLVGDSNGQKHLIANNAGNAVAKAAVSGATATGSVSLGTGAHAFLFSTDGGVTPTYNKLQSDVETVAPAATHCTSASKQIFFGGAVETSAGAQYLGAWQFVGSAMNDAARLALLGLITNPAVTISVTPASSSIAAGGATVQLTSKANRLDTTQTDVSSVTVWGTSDPTIATVSGSGLVTAAGVGTATITSTTGGVSGTASIIVVSGATVPLPVVGVDVPDRVAAALARLCEQFKNKTNIASLVTALVGPAQTIESALWQLLTQRRVSTAIGSQLDALGKLVGQLRNGASDSDYTRYISARIRTNISRGRIEDLIAIAKSVLNDSADLITVDTKGIGATVVRVTGDGTTDAIAAILISFLRDAQAAGVKLTLESQAVIDSLVYRFAMQTFVNGATLAGISSLPVTNTDNFPAIGTLLIDPYGSYPVSAGAMATAVGFGTWTRGWLCDDTSGNLVAAFGGVNLTPSGTAPTYGYDGPISETDYAVRIVAANSGFTSAPLAIGTNDLAVAMICKVSGIASSGYVRFTASSTFGAGDPGFTIDCTSGSPLTITASDSGGVIGTAQIPFASLPLDDWFVLIAVCDRGAAKIRIGLQSLSTGVQAISTANALGATSMTSAGSYYLGNNTVGGTFETAASFIAFGASAALNMSTNLATAIANFAAAIRPNLETVPYVSKSATAFQLLTTLAKTHANKAAVFLQTQPGRGFGDANDAGQPTLTGYANVGLEGGQCIDARE